MNKSNPTNASAPGAEDLSATETHLANALVLIQRVLPRLDEPGRAAEVQAALRKAAARLELARETHRQAMAAHKSGTVENVIVAIISAAIAAVLDRPHRLLSVQPSPAAVPYLNVWALEGRTQIFQSHKIR